MGDKLTEIADRADMIINGYAFTKEENVVRVLHLDPPHNAAVLSEDGSVIETNMDDIELALIGKYFARNRKFLYEAPEGIMYA